jgi:hypothetical protein
MSFIPEQFCTYIVHFFEVNSYLDREGNLTEDDRKAYHFPTQNLAHRAGEGWNADAVREEPESIDPTLRYSCERIAHVGPIEFVKA